MLVIRLFRIGKKNQPFFKIVVTDKRKPPKGGRFLERVGFWNPLKKEKKLNAERIKYWLSKGAKASDTVHNLLISEKVIEGKRLPKHKKAKKKKAPKEEEKVEVKEEIKKPPAGKEVKEEKEEKKPAQKEAKEEPKEPEKPKKEPKELPKEEEKKKPEVKEGAKESPKEKKEKKKESEGATKET